MPNGEFVGQIPIPVPDIPGVPREGTSFTALAETVGGFIGGLFGGGGGRREDDPAFVAQLNRDALLLLPFFAAGGQPRSKDELFIFQSIPTQIAAAKAELARSAITGRLPIPPPEEGGPPLVTERFAALDVPEMEVSSMALDASLLPALRPALAPTIGAIAGGFLQDILPQLFLRAPQELGMAQVPATRAPQQVTRNGEKPSTRILRQIHMSTGVRVKLSSAKALIRQLGLQNGARCLGISVTDACTLIITSSPRRRRGISGSDIRIVKRTARRFQSLQEDLSGLVSRRRAAPRRRRQHVHAIAHTAPGA